MAKRKSPSFTPPSPIVRGEELARAVKRQRAKRTKATAPRRANLERARKRAAYIGGDAGETMRRLLEQVSLQEWELTRGRVERFWDASWEFTTEGPVAYEELVEWRWKLNQDPTVSRYFEGRAVSVLLVVESHAGKRRGKMYLTGAAAGDWNRAMKNTRKNFENWAGAYGRDAQGDDFSRIREVTFLIRRDNVHPRWRSLVRGRVEERERAEDRTRARRRKR